MLWPLLCVHELFFYNMPMHRKRVILHCCMIYVTLCSLLNYKSLLIKIGFDYLGIWVDSLREHYMPSLMALKKALTGRQPGSVRESFISVVCFYIVKKQKNKEGNLKLFKKESESEKDKHC